MAKKRIKILRYFHTWALCCALVQFIISFFTDYFIFEFESLNLRNYLACKIIFLLFLIVAWNFVAWVVQNRKKPLVRKGVIYFGVFVGVYAILLAMAWPGTWLGDDVKNFTMLAKTADYHYWLNYLSSIYYIVGYMLIPVESAPIILNILIAGGIFAYLATRVDRITRNHIGFIVGLPFLIPHTIFYILYPNRPIVYGLLFLLLFAIMMLDHIERKKLDKTRTVLILILTAIIGFWRAEALLVLPAIPLLIFPCYRIKIKFKEYSKMLLGVGIVFLILALPQKAYEHFISYDPVGYRNLASYLLPLSLMLNDPNFGASDEDLNSIDAVLNIDDIKKFANAGDVPCMWRSDTCIRDYDENEYSDFVKAFTRLILTNKKAFLNARFQTFAIATSAEGDPFTTYGYVDSPHRVRFYKFLEARTENKVVNSFLNWIGALYLPTMVLLAMFIYGIAKRYAFMIGMSLLLFLIALIIFLTAPAGYFMYYFYLYLIGWFVLTCLAVKCCSLES